MSFLQKAKKLEFIKPAMRFVPEVRHSEREVYTIYT